MALLLLIAAVAILASGLWIDFCIRGSGESVLTQLGRELDAQRLPRRVFLLANPQTREFRFSAVHACLSALAAIVVFWVATTVGYTRDFALVVTVTLLAATLVVPFLRPTAYDAFGVRLRRAFGAAVGGAALTSVALVGAPAASSSLVARVATTPGLQATTTLGGVATATPTPRVEGVPVPVVAVPTAAKAFAGVTITLVSTSLTAATDRALAERFGVETGVHVNVVTADLADLALRYQASFATQSPDFDVLSMRTSFTNLLAPDLVDLNPRLGSEAKQHYPSLIENDTVNNALVALPLSSDFGMLYYRSDLLQKYGIQGPPKTWTDLERDAQAVMTGERRTNPDLSGFIFEAARYEGLVSNAQEWLASSSAGAFVERDGRVTANNPRAVATLTRVRGWVGTISPQAVTSFHEQEAEAAFSSGNALFMRNYASLIYQAASTSPVAGKFAVAPLPVERDENPVGTSSGLHLAVSKYSRYPEAATEFVRYATGPDAQVFRALVDGTVPSIPAVAARPDVLAKEPFLATTQSVTRLPTTFGVLGADATNGINAAANALTEIIANRRDPAQMLPMLDQQLRVMAH